MIALSPLFRSSKLAASLSRKLAATRSASAAAAALVTAADVQLHRIRSRDSDEIHQILSENQHMQNDLAYCLSYAQDESDFSRNFSQLFPDDRMKEQLGISLDQLKNYVQVTKRSDASEVIHNVVDDEPLPRTLEDALRPSSRAIVVTEAEKPFRVLDVNHAWEDLCGYSFLESKGKTLGSLLRGPETDQLAATSLITQLLRGEEAGTTLTNYTKSGKRFRNRVRVGPLKDDSNQVTHFVGVLKEVQDGM